MPINSLQEHILESTFRFYFEMIRECRPDIAIYALKAIFDDELYQNPRINSELKSGDILSVVDFFRKIIQHPCPQNRSESYPYVGQECGQAIYAVEEKDIQERDAKQGMILLKNGNVISSKNIIVDKIRYFDYKPPENMLTVIAREQEGLLGLTSKGPLTKNEIIQDLQKRCQEEQKHIDEKFTEQFKESAEIYKALIDGLTCFEDIKTIQVSLAKFDVASDDFKKSILLKITYFFSEEKEYVRLDKETEKDYFFRMVMIVQQKIKANLALYEDEKKDLVVMNREIENLDQDISQLEEKQKEIKKEAFNQCWAESKLPSLSLSNKDSQWKKLILYEKNYYEQEFAINGIKPILTIIEKIRLYKKLEAKINELNIKKNEFFGKKSTIRLSRDAKKNKEKRRLQAQLWLKNLRLGKFDEINKMDKEINLTAVDEFGKNAVYYALSHRNYLLANQLVVDYKVNVPNNIVAIVDSQRDDIKEALLSNSENRANAWRQVVENEVFYDLNNLIIGSLNVDITQLRRKYLSYGWREVYDGKKWTSLFESIFEKYTVLLIKNFESYIWGAIIGDLQMFHRIFLLFKKENEFERIVKSSLGSAQVLLEKCLSKGEGNLQQIKAQFERMNKMDEFNYQVAVFEAARNNKANQPSVVLPVSCLQEVPSCKQETPPVILEDKLKLAENKPCDQKNQFIILEKLIDAIKKEITRFSVSKTSFTIGMRRKEALVQQALDRAEKALAKVEAKSETKSEIIDKFIDFKERADTPSLKEALNNPRKFPGCQPLWGDTDAWLNVKAVIEALKAEYKESRKFQPD